MLIRNDYKIHSKYDIFSIQHLCNKQPKGILIEKQIGAWHVHYGRSIHSRDLKDGKCPYCEIDLYIELQEFLERESLSGDKSNSRND